MADNRVTNVYLVAAGDFHDIDFARLELLKLLAEREDIRTTVAANYHDVDAIADSDVLISYTCNLVPSEAEQRSLQDFVSSGKRWLALHGTNSILEFLADGRVDAPENAPVLMQTLGTQFIAHPPIQPFTVRVADPDHELVTGINEYVLFGHLKPVRTLRLKEEEFIEELSQALSLCLSVNNGSN